ncbi:MAG: Uncharacterised protein [Formosa sp. Hel1_33_131]|nr:MAG: Uncharacterised protein [Formosa sp. Hel1_33_131]|tara:strand:+ start:782 stop:1051 length:270 start_codon:yes stop_codon:yes gene_type:complete
MINKTAKESIKSIIGHRYAYIIQKELNDSNEYNKDGESYSTGHITNVMNGEKHDIIEAAIYRVVENRLEIQRKRDNLLNNKSANGAANL